MKRSARGRYNLIQSREKPFMADETQKPQEGAKLAPTDSKKTLGLICMLVNILVPLFTGFLAVGIGGIIYGAIQRAEDPSTEKFFKNGLIQLIASAGSLILLICCSAFAIPVITGITLGLGVVLYIFVFILLLPPLAMYIWAIVDAVNIYQHSQA